MSQKRGAYHVNWGMFAILVASALFLLGGSGMLPLDPTTNPILASGYFYIGIVALGYAAYILMKWLSNKAKYKSNDSTEKQSQLEIKVDAIIKKLGITPEEIEGFKKDNKD